VAKAGRGWQESINYHMATTRGNDVSVQVYYGDPPTAMNAILAIIADGG
jgi:hypothetical protein